MSDQNQRVEQAYALAKQQYADWGVNVDEALCRLAGIPISMHCWQGDDVGGLRDTGEELGGGLAVTGNYPGRARTPEELRADLELAFSLLPGTHRLNLHASMASPAAGKWSATRSSPSIFSGWIDWAKGRRWGWTSTPRFSPIPRRPTA